MSKKARRRGRDVAFVTRTRGIFTVAEERVGGEPAARLFGPGEAQWLLGLDGMFDLAELADDARDDAGFAGEQGSFSVAPMRDGHRVTARDGRSWALSRAEVLDLAEVLDDACDDVEDRG